MTRGPRPSVLLLITTFDVGGAERVYLAIARGLAERGYRVFAACLDARSGVVARELDGTAVTTVDLGMRNALGVPGALARLIALLRRERIDVVYTFLIHAHLVGRIAARLARVPVLLSSQQVMSWESPIAARLNRLTGRWCSAVIGVSRNVSRYLVDEVRIAADRVVTIYNCVDVTKFVCRPAAPERPHPVIGSIARLNPEKDQDSLLRAFALVSARYPAAQLLIAGDGPERARLTALAGELGLGARVTFLGHVADVRPVHARLDVFVQASHVEGLPVAVLEALASCLPVVAMRVGGNDEAVVDGQGGLLVPPQDVPALAAAMLRVIDDPAEARRMGEFGRAHVVRYFSHEACIAATDVLMVKLLDDARTVGRGEAA
jgi:glycosyltransferase involved in cell wall biosynthesis